MPTAIFLGVKGSVIALDRATGREIWRANLKGSQFVNVVLDNDRVIATTKGEIFCLDSRSGKLLWRNELPGQGRGLVTIATSSGSANFAPSAETLLQDDGATAAIIASAT